LNSRAKPSTTNIPPNVVRSSPISVSVATSAATTPTSESGIDHHLCRGASIVSATSTSTIVVARISSGRIAW
jgi:hypothetical protein